MPAIHIYPFTINIFFPNQYSDLHLPAFIMLNLLYSTAICESLILSLFLNFLLINNSYATLIFAPMQRYFLHIAYDGSAYHGWQMQPESTSVQEIITQGLRTILRQPDIQTVGCGRTDSGVHATQFYLHFDSNEILVDPAKDVYRLNNFLPFDIACFGLLPMHNEAHARFDATERAYEYRIHTVKDPFLNKYSVFTPYDLDVELMNKAGQMMLNHTDFAAFCKSGSDQHTTLCELKEVSWLKLGNQLKLHIRANRFLRNMVRAIVGTMIDLGRGQITLEEFESILNSGNRSNAGTSAPAHGLYLSEVKYPYL